MATFKFNVQDTIFSTARTGSPESTRRDEGPPSPQVASIGAYFTPLLLEATLCILAIATLMVWSTPAEAHVKWFTSFDIATPARPISETLSSPWFWLAVGIAVPLFALTAALERTVIGTRILILMDSVSEPLWNRADDFVRAITGGFFVAIFVIGGVYLTPDLPTPSEWVSWSQLVIAAGLFSRRTMWVSAIGVLGLWIAALHQYQIFHLLDYVVLGLGVAGYLVLFSLNGSWWHKQRFNVLRWAIAITLMRSSFEKFAYPEWFQPLAQQRPFLTFGMPTEVFLPMAGVVEFTLGLGLLWTPLIRRSSAIALLIIFSAAVVPFGRLDLVGHSLIIMMLVIATVDPTRDTQVAPAFKRAIVGVPAGFVAALAILAPTYWSLHMALYGH
ncbi:DoxX family membrane protein [Rhizobium grahamii]|uniref:Membrane protein n=1 Tax=Rhizobium grahamii CCGE 502 TaxID=990285 RepID=S3HPS5_9HYPH|nr:DoxX family membrane protein [Rhizobium grahamii]EPE95346.1 membrane protein [Rhizobium grahamii CCGE 502]